MTKSMKSLAHQVPHAQPKSSPPPAMHRPRSSTKLRAASQRDADLEAILVAEKAVREGEEIMEELRGRLSESIVNWLDKYGERQTRIDRELDEEYTVPHYPHALPAADGVFQLFVRRSKNRQGEVKLTGTMRRISTGGPD